MPPPPDDRAFGSLIKAYARAHPHKMGAWSGDSKTHVASMPSGDFYGSEKTSVMRQAGWLRVELHPARGGDATTLKELSLIHI